MAILIRVYILCVAFMVIDFCETEEVSYNDAKVVCYFASWATYRPSDGKFDVEDIDSSLCTHAIYAFAGINNHTLKMEPLDEYNDLPDEYGLNAYGRFVDLKTNNPHLKVLLAVGGYNQASSIFSRMASEQSRRERFIDSALSLIKKYGFDGLDLDWEFPTTRGGKPDDKENFVLLVQEMKKKFEESSLIITAAVGLGSVYMETVYDFKNLSDSLDSIHLMAYDFNGNWERKTYSYSPLFSRPEYTGKSNLCSINATVNVWLEGGADPKKLVLGVGAYGQTYLVRNCIGEIGELGFGAGQAGPYTKHSGTLGYNEICEAIKNDGASIERDEYSVTPYTCLGSTWASYDDILSAKIKSMWGKETGLGGGMIWSIDTDDFLNKCSDGRYPILRAINEIWRNVTPVSVKTLNPVKRLPTEAKVICYYSSWAYYRHGEGKFTVNDIKPSLCTHIIYCFAGINEWSYKIESTDKNVDIYQNGYANITNLKLKYPNLKIMLSIGGASKKSVVFSQMAADSYSRTTFIDSVINYLQFYSFDGLDLMWEYPANNGGSDEDKENFALLITEMREKFDEHSYVLSASTGVSQTIIASAYDMRTMALKLDFINLLTFDYHGSWESETNHHSPLHPMPEDTGKEYYSNSEMTVQTWIDAGTPANKLILGYGMYGRSFTIDPDAGGDLETPSTGAGVAGKYTQAKGFLAFYEVCPHLSNSETESNEYVLAPWSYKSDQWVSYDNAASVKIKTKWARRIGLGGGLAFSIDTDDFRNICGLGEYPLLSALSEAWLSSSSTKINSTSTKVAAAIAIKQITQMATTEHLIESHKTSNTTPVIISLISIFILFGILLFLSRSDKV